LNANVFFAGFFWISPCMPNSYSTGAACCWLYGYLYYFLRSLGFSFCFVCTYKEHFIESFLRVFQPGRNFKGKMNKWVRVLTNLSILFSGASRFMTTCIFEDRFFGLHTHFRRNKERTSKVTLSPAGYLLADVWIL